MSNNESGVLLGGLVRVAATGVAILGTRLSLVAIETEQQIRLLTRVACLTVGAALAAGFALFFMSALMIVIFWESHRVLATALVSLGFSAMALILLIYASHLRRSRPQWLASSIHEITQDLTALRDAMP